MTASEFHHKTEGNTQAKRLAYAFIPLLLCYAGTAFVAFLVAPAFFTESYFVSCPVPFVSVYGALQSLALCLRSTVLQVLLLLLAVFTLFPWWISAAAAVYRGFCTGGVLYAVSSGAVSCSGYMEGTVSLYFLASVLLILLSAVSCTCAEEFLLQRRRRDKRNAHALLFSYLRTFAVMSGGILALSGFAILFC